MNLKKSVKYFLKNNFHALTHKNYRYYWTGQCVSLIGTWTQNIGQSWLVLSLTGSPFLLGLVGTIQFLPITVFSLFAGVIIDKFSKKKILLITQTISMVLAFALSALVFTKTIKYQYIIVLAFILGCNNTIDTPTRQSFTIEVAGKEDLMNAIALNSATFNLARIIGPAIGALLMAYLGAGWCFLLNGLSFIAVIYGIMQIEAKPYVRKKQNQTSVLKEIGDGLKYIKTNKILMQSILLTTIMGIFAFNYSVLIPVFTKNVLMMQEKTYGFLMSALGVGSLIGALSVSLKSKKGPKMTAMVRSIAVVSILLICTGITKYYYITALSLAITGVFNIMFSTTANSTLQMNSKDEYRGRVMSVYSLVFAGSTPIGNMFSGYTADKFGAGAAFILSGGVALFLLIIVVIIFKNKRIEDEKLILDEV
jgi:MFS family permease